MPGKRGGAEGGAGWVQEGRFAAVDKDPVWLALAHPSTDGLDGNQTTAGDHRQLLHSIPIAPGY